MNYEQLSQIKGIGHKRLNQIISILENQQKTLDDLFKMPVSQIQDEFSLPRNIAEAIAQASLVKEHPNDTLLLSEKGIKRIARSESSYPFKLQSVLGETTPPLLYTWGNLELIHRPAIGFCGSRNVTSKGLEVTHNAAKQIAELGWVVISGHAKGVDLMAHETALKYGGSTIVVAPEGLLGFKLRSQLKKIAKPDKLLILSEFNPHAGWSVGNAMQRNNTIVALSDAMILVEAREEGGTFEAGKSALRLKVPLFVVEYQTPGASAAGNVYFLQRGAFALRKNAETGQPNIDLLKEKIQNQHNEIAMFAPVQTPLLSDTQTPKVSLSIELDQTLADQVRIVSEKNNSTSDQIITAALQHYFLQLA